MDLSWEEEAQQPCEEAAAFRENMRRLHELGLYQRHDGCLVFDTPQPAREEGERRIRGAMGRQLRMLDGEMK